MESARTGSNSGKDTSASRAAAARSRASDRGRLSPRILIPLAAALVVILAVILLLPVWRDRELRRWAAANAIPLSTTDPLKPVDDLGWLHGRLRNATVVGLGEATHGTREFFLMKARIVRFLVEREGFTVFAIEANLPEAAAINRYVVNGDGDARAALAGLHFWTWDTYEVLDLIEWIRTWNAQPGHPTVHFYGFDCQRSAIAAFEVGRYLERVDRDIARTYEPLLTKVAAGDATHPALPVAEIDAARRDFRRLLSEFDRSHVRWASVEGEASWDENRQYCTVLQQSWDIRTGGLANRDRYMAENILWIARHEHGARIAVWAHNSHVERSAASMGGFLNQEMDGRYAAIGFSFGWGEFRAVPSFDSQEVRTVSVSPSDAPKLDAALLNVPLPFFALDLRSEPALLKRPIAMREYGAVFGSPTQFKTREIDRAFDILIFVRQTTASRPTPTGVRPRKRQGLTPAPDGNGS